MVCLDNESCHGEPESKKMTGASEETGKGREGGYERNWMKDEECAPLEGPWAIQLTSTPCTSAILPSSAIGSSQPR